MELGVYSNSQGVVIVKADYDFFSCSAIKSCSECTSSKWGCDWCVYAGRCTLDGDASCIADDEMVVENRDGGSCPQLHNVSTEILIPVGLRRVIHLTGTNLPSTANPTQVDYKCVLSRDGIPFKTVSVSNVNSTFVECEETEYDYDSSDGLEIKVSIGVEYLSSGVFIDNKNNTVTLYNCSVNGMSCRSCVTPEIRVALGCGWCEGTSTCQVNVDDRQCESNFLGRGDSTSCPNAVITKIFPVSGPIEGNTTLTISGTNLAAQFDEISNITVATVECIATNLTFNPGTSIDCVTGSSHNETLEGPVTVVFSFGSDTSEESFSYRNPSVSEFSPVTGIAAGGTELEISGNDLNTGRDIRVFVGNAECKITENSITSELIRCLTGRSDQGDFSVTVSFDGAERVLPGGYLYAPNPSIEDYAPKESIMSGGIELTVSGTGFSILQTAELQLTSSDTTIIEQECLIISDSEINCLTPNVTALDLTPASSRRRRQAAPVGISFILDGLVSPADNLEFYPDPVYDTMNVVIKIPGEIVTLTGENLNRPSENIEEFVTVCMGQGKCEVTEATPTSLNCLSPAEQPENGICKGNATDFLNDINVVVFHGENIRQYIGSATYDTSSNDIAIIVGASVGGVVLFSIVLFLAFVGIGHRNYKATIMKTEMEMENLMQNSRREVMTGFFIDQEMTDIEDQLKGLGMPFVSNHDYMKSMLFFGLDVKPDDQDPELPSESEEMAMIAFSKLLSNKDFLLIFIKALDKCRKITTKEKANIASLLTVVLVMEKKFKYFTDVLTTLMSDTMGEAADRQRLKQLFKRTESLEDKMLNNWIALAMFKFIKESAGEPLYKLYQAIKIQCEKGPVDALTGQSYFSLNFDNLLTESQEFEEVTLNVESELGPEEVRVLNVDTITQVKEKILDAMYRKKHTKYQRSAREVDLVVRSGQTGQLVLSDYDTSSHPSLGWCEVNTIKHYGIQTGSRVGLTDKQSEPNSDPVPMNDAANNLFTLFPEFHKHSEDDTKRQSVRVTGHHDYSSHDLEKGPQGLKYYHLVQSDDIEEDEEKEEGFCDKMQRVLCFKGTQGKRKIREIYLQRLVSVKQSINNFVNDALKAMFTIQENGYENNLNNIPFALRFLFNFFDEEASRYDEDESTTWKNNILPLRFWATILAHPSFIFNMRQSRTADASVTVLNQMLDNAAKGVVPKLKMNSSPSRLLFNRELPSHIDLLVTYYHNIKQSGGLEEVDLKEECSRIDVEFTGLFSRLTTLRKLYESIRTHEEILVEALEKDEICSQNHFASSLERVGNTLYQTED
nr:plexin-A2-like isoform X1 [Lytechinus pictus]